MPARPVLNASFLAVASVLGMNIPITDSPALTNLSFDSTCNDIARSKFLCFRCNIFHKSFSLIIIQIATLAPSTLSDKNVCTV